MTGDLADRPPFIVWRPARGVPPGFMPPGMDGRWEDRGSLPALSLRSLLRGEQPAAHAIAIRTDRVEHRDSDGASAEVWEIHPIGGNYPDDPAERLPL
jgi:hypothetical protein